MRPARECSADRIKPLRFQVAEFSSTCVGDRDPVGLWGWRGLCGGRIGDSSAGRKPFVEGKNSGAEGSTPLEEKNFGAEGSPPLEGTSLRVGKNSGADEAVRRGRRGGHADGSEVRHPMSPETLFCGCLTVQRGAMPCSMLRETSRFSEPGSEPVRFSNIFRSSGFRTYSGHPVGRAPAGELYRHAPPSCRKDVFLRAAGKAVQALVSVRILQSKAGVICTAGAQNEDAPGKMAS